MSRWRSSGHGQVAAIKAPGFGDNRKAILQDLAVLTGAELITEELGGKLEASIEGSKAFGKRQKGLERLDFHAI